MLASYLCPFEHFTWPLLEILSSYTDKLCSTFEVCGFPEKEGSIFCSTFNILHLMILTGLQQNLWADGSEREYESPGLYCMWGFKNRCPSCCNQRDFPPIKALVNGCLGWISSVHVYVSVHVCAQDVQREHSHSLGISHLMVILITCGLSYFAMYSKTRLAQTPGENQRRRRVSTPVDATPQTADTRFQSLHSSVCKNHLLDHPIGWRHF